MADTKTQTLTATITVHNDGTPSAHYPADELARNGAVDYSVSVTFAIDGCASQTPRAIEDEITLYRDPINGGMSPCGSPMDGWVGGSLVKWIHRLNGRDAKAVLGSLSTGVGVETLEITSYDTVEVD